MYLIVIYVIRYANKLVICISFVAFYQLQKYFQVFLTLTKNAFYNAKMHINSLLAT